MSYIALATTTLGSAAGSVTFSSIPTSVNGVALRDLVLIFDGTLSSSSGNIRVQFNGDTSSSYTYVFMLGSGSGSGASGAGNFDGVLGGVVGASIRSAQIFQVMDYSATDKHKTVLNRSASQNDNVYAIVSRWPSNTAVNSIRVIVSGVNLASGTTISLYGVA